MIAEDDRTLLGVGEAGTGRGGSPTSVRLRIRAFIDSLISDRAHNRRSQVPGMERGTGGGRGPIRGFPQVSHDPHTISIFLRARYAQPRRSGRVSDMRVTCSQRALEGPVSHGNPEAGQ